MNHRRIITTAIVTAGLALSATACGSSSSGGSGSSSGSSSDLPADCIVLANGGNKLCGDTAKAWCTSTDDTRRASLELAQDADLGDPQTAASIQESQSYCDALRAQ